MRPNFTLLYIFIQQFTIVNKINQNNILASLLLLINKIYETIECKNQRRIR